jgi:hypothetical protein
MATTTLGLFNNKLISFFEDLVETFPEERDIKLAIDTLQGAKKINPRLILDLFMEFVTKPLKEHILAENEVAVIAFAKVAIQTQFNEISPALMIFDKYWPSMSDSNRDAIWKHLKVLVLLSEKARA